MRAMKRDNSVMLSTGWPNSLKASFLISYVHQSQRFVV